MDWIVFGTMAVAVIILIIVLAVMFSGEPDDVADFFETIDTPDDSARRDEHYEFASRHDFYPPER